MSEVTVVVMTRDRWPDLSDTLPRHEGPVIVVDNGSTDGTPARVRAEFPHVEVVELDRNAGAVARNIGVLRAATPLVAFADDDSWWAPGALDHAAQVFADHPRLGLLAAQVLVAPDDRPDPICAQQDEAPLGRAPDLPGPSVLGFLACGSIVRRDAFLQAGGFDDVVFFAGEEERLSLDLARTGWGQAYVESVVAHHRPSVSRDGDGRAVLEERNRLLTEVLRRPWSVVLARVAEDLCDPVGRAALRHAAPRLPRALRRRRPLPPDVERLRRALT